MGLAIHPMLCPLSRSIMHEPVVAAGEAKLTLLLACATVIFMPLLVAATSASHEKPSPDACDADGWSYEADSLTTFWRSHGLVPMLPTSTSPQFDGGWGGEEGSGGDSVRDRSRGR